MNRLTHESSLYLRQHASNPVDWWPWCEEAFAEAARMHKPVLLSIGYSSCHWCHVMEHESFQEEATARLMNEKLVCIKVDREEYPDIDHFYMDAVQAMTGSGGWPLHVFLTPEKKPFYGGTYFPPRPMHGRLSWQDVVLRVSNYYQQQQGDVLQQSDRLFKHLQQVAASAAGTVSTENTVSLIPVSDIHEIKDKLMQTADIEWGGFGQAPKFPATFCLQFLQDYSDTDTAEMDFVNRSLYAMYAGGMYDHVGGGFARYSTDRYWHLPHFEKMLYDNALLLSLYAGAYKRKAQPVYAFLIRQTMEWLEREMHDEDGGYYASQDADSEGEEGKYYCWSIDQWQQLDGDLYVCLNDYLVLDRTQPAHVLQVLTLNKGLDANHQMEATLQKALQQLLAIRQQRIPPPTDTKKILGWNALLAEAMAEAGEALSCKGYQQQALHLLDYLLAQFKHEEGYYLHLDPASTRKIRAYADDLLYLASACMTMSVMWANPVYLERAMSLTEEIINYYCKEASNFCSFTHQLENRVPVAREDMYDGALPSANAVFCKLLYQLSVAYSRKDFALRSSGLMKKMLPLLRQFPSSFGYWCREALHRTQPEIEVVVTGPEAAEWMSRIRTICKRSGILYFASRDSSDIPVFLNRVTEGMTQVFICRDMHCLPPLRDINSALTEIQKNLDGNLPEKHVI